ncbi:hypothetical protein ElyMa_006023500 [Elysia marginata]|uniref:Uncharacterized protein n=1 Tax=Elysia marginata TaxID=1093978 RepID=A0AAV4GIC5_9GAST|nr:hypothetical protein ElyMa_006023500 [Elysia marginata]
MAGTPGAGICDKVGGVTALRLADPSAARHLLLRDLIAGNNVLHFDWQEAAVAGIYCSPRRHTALRLAGGIEGWRLLPLDVTYCTLIGSKQ